MPADDSHPWSVHTQPPGWDPERANQLFEEAKAERRGKHQERLAERKRDRQAARRLAKGFTASPTVYPWLKPDWVDPPVLPLRLRNRLP